MRSTEIAPEQWPRFCMDFSRQHRGWLVTTSIVDRESRATAVEPHRSKTHATARDLPFAGLSAGPGSRDFLVELGEGKLRISEPIRDATRICMLETDDGAHAGLRIDRPNDSLLLTFRVAAQPDSLDGIAATEL